MWTNDSIDLVGYDGRRIYNRHFTNEQRSSNLCVVVAGFGYTLQAPYLYYSKAVPFGHGYDVLTIDFAYSQSQSFLSLSEDEKERAFLKDVDGIRAYLEDDASQRRLAFIGKSLGTTTVFRLLQREGIINRTDGCVWLTPGQDRFGILEFLLQSDLPGIVAWGTADRYAKDVDWGRLVDRESVLTYTVQGGDHLLETDDRSETLGHLEAYLNQLDSFFVRLASRH